MTPAQRTQFQAAMDSLRAMVVGFDPVASAPPVPVPAPPAPTPAPPAPTPPAPVGATLYFSPSGSNANAGTISAPKLNLSGINLNTLPPTTLLFQGGSSWTFTGSFRLMNPNVNSANRLVFDSYGTGQATLRWTGPTTGPAFEWGEWAGTTLYAGYTFRNLTLDGTGATRWGFWLRGSTDAVLIENCTITGFQIGINGQGGQNVRGLTVRGCRITRNSDMGCLGSFSDSLFENNEISENNFTGSGFSHGTYFSNFTNLTVRGNHYLRNSVLDGVARGGNCTVHGQNDGFLFEDNKIEQDSSAPGAWQLSITQGYSTPEWFRNFVVRNNRFKNAGNNAVNCQSAPGILVEGNIILNTQGTNQTGISVGHTDYPNGDDHDGGGTVRNNTIYQLNGSTGTGVFVYATALNTTQSNNVVRTELPADFVF